MALVMIGIPVVAQDMIRIQIMTSVMIDHFHEKGAELRLQL